MALFKAPLCFWVPTTSGNGQFCVFFATFQSEKCVFGLFGWVLNGITKDPILTLLK